MTRQSICLTLLCAAASANGATFDLATATGLYVPSFRGDASTTYLGWDVFGDPGITLINDTTPDLGAAAGSFVTSNGEPHQSGSLNYYTGGGSVAEDITFETAGVDGSGYTTVIVQAKTLFGGWGADIYFSDINGVAPSQVLMADNAAGAAQLFAKYEIPGTASVEGFSISSGPYSYTSFDQFVIDTTWSSDGFAAITAVATPEPTSTALVLLAGCVAAATRR